MKLLTLLIILVLPSAAFAKLVTQPIDYKDASGTLLHGLVICQDKVLLLKGKVPGVLIIHDWRGISSENQRRAEMIAELGYVAFVADIYGKDLRNETHKEWALESSMYKADRPLFRERARAAYDALAKLSYVNPQRIAAIGYCFGGTGVLEMARDGLDLRGIVSFHGGLDAQPLTPGATIKPKMLLLCGADDPFQKPADLQALETQLKENKVDYQIISYPGAVHSFTDPGVDALKINGAKYNAPADQASWQAMKTFLHDILQP